MIVEGVVLGIIVVGSFSVGGIGLATVAKAETLRRAIADNKRKRVTMTTEAGTAHVYIDEFVDDEGRKHVDFSVEVDDSGKAYVLTKAEAQTLAAKGVVQKLARMHHNQKLSGKGWERIMKPLFDAINARREEIKNSPTRKAEAEVKKAA